MSLPTLDFKDLSRIYELIGKKLLKFEALFQANELRIKSVSLSYSLGICLLDDKRIQDARLNLFQLLA